MKRTSRKGFTLIELIVTIVILGILAALAVPAFQAVIERSRENAAVQATNGMARELHALAAFDADFAGTDAEWDAVLDEAVAAGDVPANATVVDLGTAGDGVAIDQNKLQVTVSGYTAQATLGTSAGAFDATSTVIVP